MASPSAHRFPAEEAASASGRPLTPFEQLMLVDERPGHSMCFFLENMVTGPLREQPFRAAVERAARRHPLLCSRVDFRRGGPAWLPPDVLPTVIWDPAGRDGDPWRPFDLRRESGARIVVLGDGGQRHRVVFQMHHSACDGVAGCEFMGDIWAVYAGLEPRPFSRPRAARAAEAPGHAADSAPATGGRDALREAWSFAAFWPRALARLPADAAPRGSGPPLASDRPRDPRSPPYWWLDFDQAATERLRVAASAAGLSLNDSIVAAAMRAAVAWNVRAGRRPGNVRVTVPVNLRQPGQREPADNRLGYAFLDRTVAQCAAARQLTTSIAAATRWVLDHGAAVFFLDSLAAIARHPWLLRLVTRIPLCISTVVVSNIGDPSRRMRSGVGRVDGRDAPAGLVIEGCIGVPPLRPRTRASIGVTTYAGSLSLCCLCSAHPDPHEGARRFLDLVRQELEGLAAGGMAADAVDPAN